MRTQKEAEGAREVPLSGRIALCYIGLGVMDARRSLTSFTTCTNVTSVALGLSL